MTYEEALLWVNATKAALTVTHGVAHLKLAGIHVRRVVGTETAEEFLPKLAANLLLQCHFRATLQCGPEA